MGNKSLQTTRPANTILAAKPGKGVPFITVVSQPRGGAPNTARSSPRTSLPSRLRSLQQTRSRDLSSSKAWLDQTLQEATRSSERLVSRYLHVSNTCGAPEMLRLKWEAWLNTLTSAAAVELAGGKTRRMPVGLREPFPTETSDVDVPIGQWCEVG